MSETDPDPELLRLLTAATEHVGKQAIVHNEAEVVGSVPGLLDTLAPNGPYGYMLMPKFQPDGSIRLPVHSTREEVRAIYESVRGNSDVISEEPIIELRTPWYAFWETVSSGQRKPGGQRTRHPLAVLSPAGSSDGITGEIIWPILPRDILGVGEDTTTGVDEYTLRLDLRLRHIRMVDVLAAADVDGLLAELDPGSAAAVRDYVHDTDALVELVGLDGQRAYYEAFFARYEMVSVELLHRVTQPWFLFAETRLTVRERSSDATCAFHVAEILAPGKSGALIATLGWGTDPA